MFSHISMNWRGRPLISHDVIVSLINATTTRSGLTVQAALDRGTYDNGIKVTDDRSTRWRSPPPTSTATGTTRSNPGPTPAQGT